MTKKGFWKQAQSERSFDDANSVSNVERLQSGPGYLSLGQVCRLYHVPCLLTPALGVGLWVAPASLVTWSPPGQYLRQHNLATLLRLFFQDGRARMTVNDTFFWCECCLVLCSILNSTRFIRRIGARGGRWLYHMHYCHYHNTDTISTPVRNYEHNAPDILAL